MVEIYLLEQLLAVYEYGTLSAASEKLHLSQPSLTRSMQKLESLMGVSLFLRKKNKIVLNDNGKLLAEYAQKVLNLELEMMNHVRDFDKSNHTLLWGSCALTPSKLLLPSLQKCYPDKEVSCEIENESVLLDKLNKNIYHFIVLTHSLEEEQYICKAWKEEHLFATLPLSHTLSRKEALYLSELDESTILLYSHVGFWQELLKSKMPNAHFVIHDEYDIVNHLIRLVNWPIFQTNYTINTRPELVNHVNIPILDAEANVTYYIICKRKNFHKLASFFQTFH